MARFDAISCAHKTYLKKVVVHEPFSVNDYWEFKRTTTLSNHSIVFLFFLFNSKIIYYTTIILYAQAVNGLQKINALVTNQ